MARQAINKAFDSVELPVDGVLAIQTTRLHPVNLNQANAKFGQFNLGVHVGDNKTSVMANRQVLQQFLPKGAQIQWLEQVHGDDVTIVEQVSNQAIVADAAVTTTRNIALAVMTADCLPIILADKNGHEVAVIHGGWKPLVKGIIQSTIENMKSSPSDIHAWLGPCIGANSFEVGAEVRENFIAIGAYLSSAFVSVESAQSEKYLGDLPKIAITILNQSGISNIVHSNSCTVAMNERYYSYRKEQVTGRMATIVCLC
ncbi:peptidoglycan editing factor PgeF [Thalassotalea fusca]